MHATDSSRKWIQVPCPVCETLFNQRPTKQTPNTCSKSCARKLDWQRSGKQSKETYSHTNGYIWQKVSNDHPYGQELGGKRQTRSKYILQHRYIMEQKLGRFLDPHERVHHKNGKRDDNRLENLELWSVDRKDPPGQRVEDLLNEFKNSISFLSEPEIDEVVNKAKEILLKL